MQYTGSIDNRGILEIIRRSCSYVDARLMNHGYRVAYIVSEMLKPYFHEDARKIRDVCFLALLHDIGAYKTDEISKMLQFDTDDVLAHSVYGYLFIKYFSPLKKLSGAILLHHATWRYRAASWLPEIPDISPGCSPSPGHRDRADPCVLSHRDNRRRSGSLSYRPP